MKLLALAIIFFPVAAIAQVLLSADVGYGEYNLADMKIAQQELGGKNVPKTITRSFPPGPTFEIGCRYLSRHFVGGLAISVAQTTGDVSYTDSYGQRNDAHQRLSHLSFGWDLGYCLRPGAWLIEFKVRPSIILSQYDLTRTVYDLQGAFYKVSSPYASFDFAIQPMISVSRRWGHFGVNVYAGYCQMITEGHVVAFPGKYPPLTDSDGKDLKIDWSGIRAGGGLSFFMGRKWVE